MTVKILDCTLRDGGYYNDWNFSLPFVNKYLSAISAAQVDIAELGFRFFKNEGFKGPCAYTTDNFLRRVDIPKSLSIGVMINASDLCSDQSYRQVLEHLFPIPASDSPVDLVRIACHYYELPAAIAASAWLHQSGYRVGINIMQISNRTKDELITLTNELNKCPIEVLYFADSMGCMNVNDIARFVSWLRERWVKPLGIHTHDNMGLALSNTLEAWDKGVTWLDCTVSGMGRGAGNVRTEELVIEAQPVLRNRANLVPLMKLARSEFASMKSKYNWGTSPFYYLAGKHSIHPTYIQEMIGDSRYGTEDILAVIEHLKIEESSKFCSDKLESALNFYSSDGFGKWNPSTIMEGRDVLILATGPGVKAHVHELQNFIRREKPLVIALNTQSDIDQQLINLRVACHPIRLLADAKYHLSLPQPLIVPASMLPKDLLNEFRGKELLDFGLGVKSESFEFYSTHCVAPNSLVLSYALGVVKSGNAGRILMAGFDGYLPGDARNDDIERTLSFFLESSDVSLIEAITPTIFKQITSRSIYAL